MSLCWQRKIEKWFFSKSGKIVRFYIEISRMANFSPEKADFVFLTFFPCSLVNFEQEKLYYKPNNHTLKNDKNWPGWDKTVNGRSKCVSSTISCSSIVFNADYVLQLLMKGSMHSSFLYERSLEEIDAEESPKLRKK